MYKIIGADLKEYGPVSADQLRQWIAEGRINGQTRIQPAGSETWRTVAEFPEFASIVPPPVGATLAPGMAMPPAAVQKTNQLALWAMITGIISLLCCCNFLGILSLILGLVGLSQIKKQPGQPGSGYAVAGIVLGVISILLLILGKIVIAMNPDLVDNIRKAFPQF